ncbi:MAG: cryptochrome/photolyase family protein [Paracoccaceae bacterium]
MVTRLVLVLGDQLSEGLSALRAADKDRDIVVMAEVAEEAGYVPHHPKKIAFLFAAMRKFAQRLQDAGWRVAYTRLDDTDNSGAICGELLRRAAEHDATGVIATQPGEWRLIGALGEMPLKLHIIRDDRFIASADAFEAWAKDKKQLRMEYFYREMRRKTGLLMEGEQPAGGKWNYDHDNRKPAPDDVKFEGPLTFEPDNAVEEVLDLVAARFGGNFGALRPFWFATDRDQALAQLDHWIKGGLTEFGDYQDAMLADRPFMYHSLISLYINAGLLDPLEVCQKVEAAWQAGKAPLNAAEGFIRQIIGWREYVRGIWYREGPDYTRRNILNHSNDLPSMYWGAPTDMRCISQTVAQTRDQAYAHHIQRLMVTGNFALLAGIDPWQVHEWYLAVYADAYEWVEAPNVIGMSLFADGGIIASKPYVSSGNYIDRMSDYCGGCAYKVKDKTGPKACPFNLLYWHFLIRHRDRFSSNPRMGQMYATWDRMDVERRKTVLRDADTFLAKMQAGDRI